MDLSKLKVSNEDFKMPILHPATREPLVCKDDSEMYISILSSDTKVAKKAMADFKRDLRDKSKALNEGETLNDSVVDECKAVFLSHLTTGCNIEFDGKKIKHSPDEMFKIFNSDGFTWLCDDVMRNVDYRGNFMQG